MTRKEFIKAVAEKSGVTVKITTAVQKAMEEIILERLPKEEIKVFDGILFYSKEQLPRKIMNLSTRKINEIPGRRVPKCRFGKIIKDAVEGGAAADREPEPAEG